MYIVYTSLLLSGSGVMGPLSTQVWAGAKWRENVLQQTEPASTAHPDGGTLLQQDREQDVPSGHAALVSDGI